MKRKLFFAFLAATFLLPWTTVRADELTVAQGTTNMQHVPWYAYWTDIRYRTEFVYPQDMVSDLAGSTITSLTFYFTTTSPNYTQLGNGHVQLLMKEVDEDVTGAAYLTDTASDEVWSGYLTVVNGVHTIELETPFYYSGSGNLCVSYAFTAGGSCGSTGIYFRGTTMSSNVSAYSSQSNYHTPGYYSSQLAECTFGYTPGEAVSICRKVSGLSAGNVSGNAATVSFTGRDDHSGYTLVLKTTQGTPDDDDDEIELGDDTSYTFDDLNPMTNYYAYVKAACSDGGESGWAFTSFRTGCSNIEVDALPVTEDFNTYTSGTQEIECWTRVSENTYGYPQTTSNNATTIEGETVGTMSYYMYSYSTRGNYLVSPYIESLEGLMASCWVYRISTGSVMTIGVMSNPNDTTTFTPLTTLALESGWSPMEVLLDLYDGEDEVHHVAFRQTMQGGSSGGLYLDNIYIGQPPACPKPQNLTASDITATGATISWFGADAAQGFRVSYVSGGTTVEEEVDETTLTLADLTPATSYTVSVTALCDDDAESITVSTTFRTECASISTLPWTENFEGFTGAAGADQASSIENIPCWDVYQNYSYYSFIQSTWNHGDNGTNAIRIYGSDQYPTYMVLPPFDEPVENLMFTFWANFDNNNLRMVTGYMTDGTNTATFVPVDTLWSNGEQNVWTYHDVTFPEGATGRIAYRFYSTGVQNVRLDDFTVMLAPSCTRPQSVVLSDITTSGATATIVDPQETGSYMYKLMMGNTVIDSATTTATEITLSNLSGSSAYTLEVYTVCGTDELTMPTIATFRTPCGATAIPWQEGFETYAYDAQPDCWVHLGSNGYTSDFLRVYNVFANTGNKCLRFNYSTPSGNVIALPEFAQEISTLEISFYHRPESNTNSSCGTFEVGYLTDVADASTFVSMGSWLYSDFTSAEYIQSDATFASAPEGARIAFRHTGNTSNWYWHLDDVDVHQAPACSRPSVEISDITAESAVVNVHDANDINHYILTLPGGSTVELNGQNTYALTELTPATTYTVSAVTVCSEGEQTAERAASFTTECATITTFPWEENFDEIPSSTTNIVTGGYQYLHCWEMKTGLYNAATGTATLADPNFDVYAVSTQLMDGSVHLRVNIYGNSTTNSRWLITPPLAIGDEGTLSFDYAFADYNYNTTPTSVDADDRFMVLASTDGGTTWSILHSWGTGDDFDEELGSVGATTQSANIDLGSVANQTVRIAFYGESTVSGSDNNFHIDNIRVVAEAGEVPEQPCNAPTNLRTTALTANSATLDWGGTATAWAISVNGGAEEEVASHPYTLEDLSPETQYTVRVKALCGDDRESDWATLSFTTPQGEGIAEAEASNVSLRPNPATSTVTVEFEGKARVDIVDMNGRQVLSAEAEQAATFEVSALARGAYFVRVTTNSGTAVRKLVVK